VFKLEISLILTVLNEADNIGSLLSSLEAQTRLPDEVVVCDAGSRDETLDILNEFANRFPCPFKIIVSPGNRSKGRNHAIDHTNYDLIACTDAGCSLDKFWLENLIKPFQEDSSIDIVSGFYSARGETLFEKCAAVVTLSTRNIDVDNFLPSARSVAFRKAAWQSVGGFPEDLEYAEDTKFGLNLRNAGKHMTVAMDAIVYWRPRGTFGQIFKQLRYYARGNAKARILLWNYARFHLRYLIWVFMSAAVFFRSWVLIFWCIAVLPYWAKWSFLGWRESQKMESVIITPMIKLVADAGQFAGFWDGLVRGKET
jgi:glycosyltransferase involved in cell wall biosynthesis